jgi:hypothetical protein
LRMLYVYNKSNDTESNRGYLCMSKMSNRNR